MIVRDDFSRFTRVFFIRTKDEKATCFSKCLAEIVPRKVEVVRSDGVMGAASFRKVILVSSAQQRKSGMNLRQPIPHNTTVLLNAKSQS